MNSALEPLDEHNRRLRANVCPDTHTNPPPAPRYNLVVIGGGPAGLVAASAAAGLGAKVALVERALMGGDCLNVGCVPSKALIAAGRAAAAVRDAHRFGVHVPAPAVVNFATVMERVRRTRADLSPHDSVARFTRLGVDVFLGAASFRDRTTIEVAGEQLRFSKAVICTGARAAAPPLAGLKDVPFLTNETLFSLTALPGRLAVIGAGPIGAEMAQTFARLGSRVTLVTSSRGLLPAEDRDAAGIVRASLEQDGVRLMDGSHEVVLSRSQDGVRLCFDDPDRGYEVSADSLLIAAGRKPNVEGLGLENADIAYSPQGVQIDDRFRTTNPRVFAAGDVCSSHRFTHAADFMARAVVRNALFGGGTRHSSLIVPRATYTAPELAHVGHTIESARAADIPIDTYTQSLEAVDRAVLAAETGGFVRTHVRKGTDKLVGATIVAPDAGDLIGEFALAMTTRTGLGTLANAIHPYPTIGEAIRKTGDLYNRTRLSPGIARIFRTWLAWNR